MPVRTFRPITEDSFYYDMCEVATGNLPDVRRRSPALPGTFFSRASNLAPPSFGARLNRPASAAPRGLRRPSMADVSSGATRPRKRAVPFNFRDSRDFPEATVRSGPNLRPAGLG